MQGRAGGARPQPTPLGAGEICPSCSRFQRKTEAARRGGIIHVGKEERSLSAEPSHQEIGRAMRQAEDEPGRPGVRADASTSRFLKPVRLISPRLPATDTCGLLHDTSLYFCNLWCPSSAPGNHCVAVINDTQAVYYTH